MLSNLSDIKVSIVCAAYNHEKYIADAIESFLMQKTDFKFEILIHDDASTDFTQEIIRKYEVLYPDIIKPIYRIENQKSQGKVVHLFNYERAQGKYIACCEGDDYWTDPYKLQKQVDYLERHPDCSLCVHGSIVVNASDKKILSENRPSKQNRYYSVEEVIEGGGGLFATNSMMFPREFSFIRPKFFDVSPVNDYPTVINLSLLGKVYYIDEIMSAYRTNVSGSWTNQILRSTEKQFKSFNQVNEMLLELDRHSKGQYHKTINKIINQNQFNILLLQKKFKKAKSGEYKQIYRKLHPKQKISIILQQYFPSAFALLRKK